MPLTPGARVGPYEVIALVGQGGMGQVYKARDTRLDRIVALKVSEERYGERFAREARAIASLNHPNICTLYDVGDDYLVMEYVEGSPLRGPLPVGVALQYAAQCAGALAAAHARGIVHRDFKPGNVLITKGGVKLLDFGLARMAAPSAAVTENTATIVEPLTREHTILGTLQYMAPEQLEGKPADARSDIFAFGLVLYEAIAGKPAFEGSSQASLIAAILKEEPTPLGSVQPVTPAALDRVVRKCLAKDPDERWQSASDLRDELLWIAQSSTAQAGPMAPATIPAQRRMPWAAAAALAIGVAVGAIWQASRTPDAAAWVGTRLDGPSNSYNPRVSPDGQLLAFIALAEGTSQVGVMKPDGSSWTVLTKEKTAGYVTDVAWAPDGSRIFFSRYVDRPTGVYSIPALGGETRLVVENAFLTTVLSDGSLAVAKVGSQGDYQLFRYWPESGRSEALPAFFSRVVDAPAVAAFPGGKEIFFFGSDTAGGASSSGGGLFALDLESKKTRRLASSLPAWTAPYRPMAATRDGSSVITMAQQQDMFQVLKVPRDGSTRYEVLFSVPVFFRPRTLSISKDDEIYVDGWVRPVSALHFSPAGGAVEEDALPKQPFSIFSALPGGRTLLSMPLAGRRQLVIASPGGELQRFLETTEESGDPIAASANGMVAFHLGTEPKASIAIASLRDGRVLHRFSMKASDVRSVALSPDGQTLYYASGGVVWSVPVSETSAPKRIADGDQAVVDPAGRFLYVQRMGADSITLVRVPATGGAPEPIPPPTDFRLTTDPLCTTAVDAQGRILLEIATTDTFFYSAAIYDPVRKRTTRIPLRFEGDVWNPCWADDGRVMAQGGRFSSSIWRFKK